MKHRTLTFLLAAFAVPATAQTPTFTVETLTLDIPKVEVIEAGVSQYFSVKFKATPDLSTFTLIAADNPPEAEIDLTGTDGVYKGHLGFYVPGGSQVSSSLPCPEVSFNPASTTVEMTTIGSQLTMSHNAFGGPVCNYTGTLEGDSLSGTFQCNDFNQGSWTAKVAKPGTSIGNTLSLHLSHTGDKCSFDTSFAGIQQ